MYMHGHAVNARRQQEGLVTINSLWCWGGGEPADLSGLDMRVYNDDFITGAFLDSAGLKPQKLQAISDGEFGQNNICLDLAVLKALKLSQDSDIHTLMDRIESSVLLPLLSHVKNGRLSLRLRTGHEFDFELNRWGFYKFWRKPPDLKDMLQ